jgi:alkylation response protein AidB-like acyl-CoA dehydrogenase
LDHAGPNVSLLASSAKALANDCFTLISSEAVQLHGGMGVTEEMDIGLFLKRSRVCNQLLGGSSYHRDRYARLNGF